MPKILSGISLRKFPHMFRKISLTGLLKLIVSASLIIRLLSGRNAWHIAVMISAVSIHEIFHLICAGILGLKATFTGIGMFGFRIDFRHSGRISEKLLVFSGGIVGNLFAASLALLFYGKMPHMILSFSGYNLLMAGINLIPAYPLDGGRILEAILEKFIGRMRAVRMVSLLGILTGTAIFIFGLNLFLFYTDNLILPVMGIFLIYNSDRELMLIKNEYVRNLLYSLGEGKLT